MKAAHKVGAGAIAICMTFTAAWEGLDLVAKRDAVGTGSPITYCHGMTSADGKVRIGQRFTPDQCQVLLGKALQKYWSGIEPCIKVDLPVNTSAALLDAALNAGSAAVCRSPMLAKMNKGDIAGGCAAFHNWYVTTKPTGRPRRLVPGLVNRRDGDYREGERQLCLKGVIAPVMTWREFFNQWRSK
jgi:lysozyme